MTSSSPISTSNPNNFSNLPYVFDKVFERMTIVANITDFVHSSSPPSKKKKIEDKQLLNTNLLRSCEFKKVLQLTQATIDSILFQDQNSIYGVDHAYQNVIDNIKSSNNELKANISRQNFILMNQINSPNSKPIRQYNSGANVKYNFQEESPELKVNQHKKEKVDARISTTTAEIQFLEAENVRIAAQINQIVNLKQSSIGTTYVNPDIEQKINQIKYIKDKNSEIEKALQNQQRNSSIFIQRERQEIDRFQNECESIQSQIASLENRIDLMSTRSLKQNINQFVPAINTAVLSKKNLQANIVPPQKKTLKRQRIVFRKPTARPKPVLPSLQPSSNDSSHLPINQDIGLMEEIAKNALLSAGDTMSTVATVTNVATASSSSQSAFDNRSNDSYDCVEDDDMTNGNYTRKRRKTIGPSPYDIIESTSFDGSAFPHPIDSLDPKETNEEEAQAAGIIGDDTCFYECPPSTEPAQKIRLKPIPPFVNQNISYENSHNNNVSIKKNPSLASNLSRTSSSEPQPQKSNLLPPTTLNSSRPNSISNNNNSNQNNTENKEPIKICTTSPLTDDLLRLPMPPVHMMMMQKASCNNGDTTNENGNSEVPILLSKMPIMVRNSAEFFSRNNSQKRNISPFDSYEEEDNNNGEKSINDLNELNMLNNNNINNNSHNNNVIIDDRTNKTDVCDVALDKENPIDFQIKEPNLNIDHLANADRSPRPKPGINQM